MWCERCADKMLQVIISMGGKKNPLQPLLPPAGIINSQHVRGQLRHSLHSCQNASCFTHPSRSKGAMGGGKSPSISGKGDLARKKYICAILRQRKCCQDNMPMHTAAPAPPPLTKSTALSRLYKETTDNNDRYHYSVLDASTYGSYELN